MTRREKIDKVAEHILHMMEDAIIEDLLMKGATSELCEDAGIGQEPHIVKNAILQVLLRMGDTFPKASEYASKISNESLERILSEHSRSHPLN